ncbi:FecR family protein [Pedobacter miscanthi]|uniref:FecR family protein n=1 Tax=Pedobacter miscanthi TaxID=2259170 RepID=UPI00292EA2EF|nr:FecR domain-containing protein [Pedobacter miscanthi]
MEKEYLDFLMRKFLSGTATAAERKELDQWYRQSNAEDVIWEEDFAGEAELLKTGMRNDLLKHIHYSRIRRFNPWWAVAASIIGLSFLVYIYLLYPDLTAPDSNKIVASLSERATENKYLFLPDSSRIVLHPGSTFRYNFNGKLREVTLTGEAYFDIKHKREPFVIHTGKIITTVLGTAFNIKAYADQPVVVSVTRGKVSVTDENTKKLVLLTPDQQVQYSVGTKLSDRQAVSSQKVISWVKADMDFQELEFGKLAGILERRYGVSIQFKNPEMRNCLITGMFKGTESVDEVFRIISATLSCGYVIQGDSVIIDGKACDQ